MAPAEASPAVPDVASFLAPTDVPTKLRCAICNKLAVNAFRLPCCDQSICETCQSSLSASCPVCEHTPLSAEDCKPNKPLRTTITVFLRTEKKKRELVEHAESPRPSAPIIQPALGATLADQSSTTAGSLREQHSQPGTLKGASNDSEELRPPHVEDQPKGDRSGSQAVSKEPISAISAVGNDVNGENTERAMEPERQRNEMQGEQSTGQGDLKVGIEGQLSQWGTGQGQQQMMGAAGVGFDSSGVGFPNMSWNGPNDFQTMMGPVQPVMPNASWGPFQNAMDMTGMNMDPMAMSQGMYGGGFGGQGMSMGGMNMGMGMGFNSGHGGYDGWNGQSTWNGGHDKFNPNANGGNASGMVGDFGANTGYHPAGGGYSLQSHGNYSQMHQPQYQNNDYQDSYQGQGYFPRGGRGRGRGYGYGTRGRGGYGYGYDGNNTPFQQQPQQYLQQPDNQVHHQPGFGNETNLLLNVTDDTSSSHVVGSTTPKGPRSAEGAENEMSEAKTLVETVVDTTTSETSKQTGEIETSRLEKSVSEPTTTKSEVVAATAVGMNMESASSAKDFAPPLAPISTYQGEYPQDFAGKGRGGNALRGPFRGSGDFRGNYRGRGGGFWSSPGGVFGHGPNQSSPTSQFPVATPTEPKPVQGLGVPGAPSAPKALREGFPNRPRGRGGFGGLGRGGFEGRGGLSVPPPPAPQSEEPAARPKSPSPSRSRSPESRQSSHRRRRNRSRSVSADESDRDQKQERRHHQSRRHKDDENGESDSKEDKITSLQPSVEPSISRSQTPERKSSHRSRHDKEKERRSSHRHRDSHRSHRDRSRDRSKEGHRRRRRSRSPGDFDSAEPTRVDQEAADGDAKEADTGRRRPKDLHSNRHHDRRSHAHTRRERSEPPEEDEAEANEQERRSYNRSSRRSAKADGVNGPSNAARERDRDRAREPDRKSRDRDRDRDRDRERDRDRDRERNAPRAAAPAVEEDPHNREREERNRERLLKEQQRREELNKERQRKDNERKRERLVEDEGDNDAAGEGDEDRHRHRRHKHRHSRRRTLGGDEESGTGAAMDGAGKERQRRMSYKYEDDESDEARAQRVENEREAARWD